ncbi:MAG: hypothetical protein JJ896_06365 [Rhodothermales bacterium]|nr:hypothetical protein [Rhodothermales bacterium]MBO6779258.1 hypothetical protein [Rhodothermales bacterium]
MRVVRIATVCLLALLVAAPASAQSDRKMNWRMTHDHVDFSVRMDGEVEFASDYRSVTRMSRDAYLRIRKEERRRDWRLDVEREGSTIVYDFRRNGDRIPAAQATEEIGDLILWVVRETGIDAERRVRQLLADGGADLVFDEIEIIQSSSSSRRYLQHLVNLGDLEESELVRAAVLAEDEIPSSGDRARFLINTVDHFAGHVRAEAAWSKTAGSVPSSGDRARTLMAGLEAELDATHILTAAKSIPSSGDKSRVLLRAIGKEMAPADMVLLLQAATSVSSSGDRSRVLIAAAPHMAAEEASRAAYFEAARGIPSSGDRARVLLAVIENVELDQPSWLALFQATTSISSSGDKARVLMRAVPFVEGERMEEAFLEAAESIPSSGDRTRVLTALVRGAQP